MNPCKTNRTKRRVPLGVRFALAIAVALSCAAGTSAWALSYAKCDYSWYDAGRSTGVFSITSPGQMTALANIVDGSWVFDEAAVGEGGTLSPGAQESLRALDGAADDFTGKTVKLEGTLNFALSSLNLNFTTKPVGTADHPFNGTFDGAYVDAFGNAACRDVGNLVITNIAEAKADKACPNSYVGLFGHVGPQGCVKNLVIGRGTSIVMAGTKASDRIAYVGSVAGWCEGAIENVTSQANVTVVWDDGKGGDARCSGGDYGNAYVVDGVGGIAGYCDGDITGATFKGSVRVNTPANATWVDETQSNAVNVVRYVGGVVGRSGGAPAGAGLAGDAGAYGKVTDCTNLGDVNVATTGAGGTDRFGETVDSKSLYVGGIAGYAIGDMAGCTNSGAIAATSHVWSDDLSYDDNRRAQFASDGGADSIGGIVGGFRSATSNGDVVVSPDGIAAVRGLYSVEGTTVDRGIAGKAASGGRANVVQLAGCTNLGSVIGCNNVGGIAGATGTYTRLVDCANGDAVKYRRDDEVGSVVSVRWNKPMTGGLVGRCMGDVCYSRNHGDVSTTKGGYYVGGLVGDLYFYRDSLNEKFVTPEVYACYSTGQIGTSVTFRRGALLGGNGGYIHDCLYLFGTSTASEDESVAAIGQEKSEDEPLKARLSVAYASDAQAAQHGEGAFSMKSAQAVAWLNSSAMRTDPVYGKTGWDMNRYYMATPSVNSGYPVLYRADALAGSAIDLAMLDPDIALVQDATYTTAFNPTPKLRVTVEVNGAQRELVENADYYVVPDENALDPVTGACKGATGGQRIYTAQVRGIGLYASGAIGAVKYAIGKGDFAECTVSAPTKKFTNEGQTLTAGEVRVLDPAGNQVDAADFTVRVNDGSPCKEPGTYKVVASAADTANYVGDVSGTFAISKIDIARDCDVVGITYDEAENGGASDVAPGIPEVWLYDDETYKLYRATPVLDEASGAVATLGEEDVAALKENAKDSEGNKLPAADQPSDEVVRGYIGYPKVEGFELYRDEDGDRWLTRATKESNEDGSLPQPSFEYTAAEIRPDVIGVNWSRGKLSFAKEGDGDIPAWRAIYGGGSGGSTSSVGGAADSGTLNVEASATGAVTVVTDDRYSTYVRNYDVMTFDIAPAAIVEDMSGRLAAAMNDQFRTFKEGDAVTPQVVVTYRGNVVKPSNYALSIEGVCDATGTMVPRRSGFIEGDTIYYKVTFRKNGSILWDGELTADAEGELLSCTVVKDRLALNASSVSVEFTGQGWKKVDGVWEKPFTLEEGIDRPAITVTSLESGAPLVEGRDYTVSYATIDSDYPGYRYAAASECAKPNYVYRPLVTITGLNGYTGRYGIYYRIKKGTLSQAQLSSIADGSYQNARFVNTYMGMTRGMSSLGCFFAYRVRGYGKGDFNNLGIAFKGSSKSGVDSYLFKVDAIKDSAGNLVERATKPGVYYLSVSADTESETYGKYSTYNNKFFDVSEGVSVTVPIEVVPVNLSGHVHVSNGASYYTYMMEYGNVFLKHNLTDKDKAKMWYPTLNEYAYTGKPVKPRYLLVDSRNTTSSRLKAGDDGSRLETDEEVRERLMADSFAHSSYDVLVEGYIDQGGPTDVGSRYQVVGLRPASGDDTFEGEFVISEGNLANNTFSVVPADISDGSVVGIRVGEGKDGQSGAQVGCDGGYLGADGAKPKVHFFVDADGIDGDDDDSLFDADEECAYVEGADYEVEYLDNEDVSPEGEKTATARIWVKDTRHLSAPGGAWDALRGWYFDVPFEVSGRQVTLNDPNDVSWKLSEQLVVGADGTLSAPAVQAAYKQDTGAGETEDVAVPQDAYELVIGTKGEGGQLAEAKDAGWKAGDTAYIGVRQGSMNRFVVDGDKTDIVGQARVIAAAPENDFADGGFPYEVALSQTAFTYGAVEREPEVHVTASGQGAGAGSGQGEAAALVEGRDFTVAYRDNVNVGDAMAVVQGIGGFTGTKELGFAIGKLDLQSCGVSGADKPYSGAPVMLDAGDVEVSVGGVAIPPEAGWALSADGWENNEDAGMASFAVVATEGGNLSGAATGAFRIVGRSLSDEACKVADPQPAAAFAPGTRALSVGQFNEESFSIADENANGRRLVLGQDFDIAGIANADGYANEAGSTGGLEYVGHATLTLVGKRNYAGTITVDVPIRGEDLSGAVLAFGDGAYEGADRESGVFAEKYSVYSGEELLPPVEVSVGGRMLDEGADYVLRYADNVNAGTARVTAVGRGVYQGTRASSALTFDIRPAQVGAAGSSLALEADQLPYTGTGAEPAGTLKLRDEAIAAADVQRSYAAVQKAAAGQPAAVAAASGEGGGGTLAAAQVRALSQEASGGEADTPAETVTPLDAPPSEPGDYRVTFTAVSGNLLGSASADFSIVAADLSKCALKVGAATYAFGAEVRPQVSIVTPGKAEVDPAKAGCTVSYAADDPAAAWGVGAAATASVTAQDGSPYFEGTASAGYTVGRIPIARADVSPADGAQLAYTGSAVKPAVQVVVGGRALAEGADFAVQALSADLASPGAKVLEIVAPEGSVYDGNGVLVRYEVVKPDAPPADIGGSGSSGASKSPDSGQGNAGGNASTSSGSGAGAGGAAGAATGQKPGGTSGSGADAGVSTSPGAGSGSGSGSSAGSGSKGASTGKQKTTISAKTVKKKFKAKKLKKKAGSFKLGAKASSGAKLTYKVTKKNKRLKFKSGKVTVKKGTKRGTYKLKVKVSAKATSRYTAAVKTFTITVKVK